MRIATVILLSFAMGASIASIYGQAAASVWDGIYTQDQAKRGEPLYKQMCASCHGDKLEGSGQAPALSGDEFKGNWNGQTVGDLFDKVQATMPADNPGSLSKEQNADILAFILKGSQFPAGQKELRGDPAELKKIRFEAAKPKE